MPHPIQSCVLGVKEIFAYCHQKAALQHFLLPQVYLKIFFSIYLWDVFFSLTYPRWCLFLFFTWMLPNDQTVIYFLNHSQVLFHFLLSFVFSLSLEHREHFQGKCGPAEARARSARSSFGSFLSRSVSPPFMAGFRGPRWLIMCPRKRFDGRSSHVLQNTSVLFALYLLSATLLLCRSRLFSCSVTGTAALGACCSLQTARLSSLSASKMDLLFALIYGKQKAD